MKAKLKTIPRLSGLTIESAGWSTGKDDEVKSLLIQFKGGGALRIRAPKEITPIGLDDA